MSDKGRREVHVKRAKGLFHNMKMKLTEMQGLKPGSNALEDIDELNRLIIETEAFLVEDGASK